jgi:hypothetical protein
MRWFVGAAVALLAGAGLVGWQSPVTQAADGLLGYWKFDEASAGSTARDESSNGNNLTPVNDPQPSTDKPSELGTAFADPYSISLSSAVGQHFSIDDTASLDATASGVTIAVWVKFSDVNDSYQSIVSKWDIGARQQWTLQLNANGKIGWWTGDGASGADNLESASTMQADRWYHIIATSEGLNKKLYIDGSPEGSKTADVAMGIAHGVGVGVGAKTEGSPEYLNGSVDDLRIYSYALDDDEASNLASGSDVQPDPALAGGSDVTHEQGTIAAISDLRIEGPTNNPGVSVKLLVSHGSLSMTTTTGLTFKNASGATLSNPQTGATLYFSGELDDINSALATLHYTRTSGTGSDTLEASLVDPGQVFFPVNNHLYEYVPGTITWNSAKPAAETRSKYGAQGYLATITSADENAFIQQRLTADGWIGASDGYGEGSVEGDWRWVAGPETGTLFWRGQGGGSTQGGNYANWNSGEPNNSGGNEDCAQFYSNGTGWNDLPCANTLPGYVVEYGIPGHTPTVSAKNIAIMTVADATPPTVPGKPTATTPTTDTTPAVGWTSASDSGTGLKNPAYTLEWSTSPSFASVAGSTTTNGTTAAPSSLADGTWYFRVKATDAAGNAATSAISDPIVIDTTAPTVPGTPDAGVAWTNDKTPSYTWDASTDTGAGLAYIAYAVEWSQDTGFVGLGGTAGTTENNYTIPDHLSLTDGTWYFHAAGIDALGHQSAWSPYATVHIDTGVPTIDHVAAADGAATGEKIVTWTTSEDASSQVLFGPTAGLGSGTGESDTSPRLQNHSVTLTDLVPCSVYHYTVTSKDEAGNSVTSSDGSFITTGCAGSASVVSHAEAPITTASGGSLGLDTIHINVPAGFAADGADFQIKKIDHTPAVNAIGTPAGRLQVGTAVYDIKALQNGTTAITSFDRPITITLEYNDADIAALLEVSLAIYRWDAGTGWTRLQNCSVHAAANTVTCTTAHFSTFALYGQTKPTASHTPSSDQGDHSPLATTQPTSDDQSRPIKNDSASLNDRMSADPDSDVLPNEAGATKQTAKTQRSDPLLGWWWLLLPILFVFVWWLIAGRRKHKEQADA